MAKIRSERERKDVQHNADAIRERCKTFRGFVKEAWHVLEPHNPYIYCWHHGAVGEHLEAVANRQITRLQINQPPATMKSMMVAVMFQAYEWGPRGASHLRYLTSSYAETYARRDSRSSRDLIMSEWFQALWPIELTRDGEMDFENTERGYRKAMPFGSLTAGRGNRVIIDDPHSVKKVESDAERTETVRLFRESITSRLNDPVQDAILVTMHRLHPDDICGEIDKLGLDYVKLILPMEYEPKTTIVSSYFEDPRTRKGELLCPERVPLATLEQNKIELGSHAYATQYQQQPSARAGGMFKRHWWKFVDAIPAEVKIKVRRWDLAGTIPKDGSDPDWSVGLLMGTYGGFYYIEDVIRFRDTAMKVRQAIQNTAASDGHSVKIRVPQDPAQAGKDQADSIIRENAGYVISSERETGSKETRAEPLAAQVEAGNIILVRGSWNQAFIDELASFPQGKADQVDCASGAFNFLAAKKGFTISEKLLAESRRPQPRRY